VSLKQSKAVSLPVSLPVNPLPNLNPLSPSIPMPSGDSGKGYALFVYNIGLDADERSLWMLFNTFGAIQKVAIMRTNDTNVCKGFGFVTMAEIQSAMNAIQSLNGYVYKGRPLQVSFKQAKNPTATGDVQNPLTPTVPGY